MSVVAAHALRAHRRGRHVRDHGHARSRLARGQSADGNGEREPRDADRAASGGRRRGDGSSSGGSKRVSGKDRRRVSGFFGDALRRLHGAARDARDRGESVRDRRAREHSDGERDARARRAPWSRVEGHLARCSASARDAPAGSRAQWSARITQPVRQQHERGAEIFVVARVGPRVRGRRAKRGARAARVGRSARSERRRVHARSGRHERGRARF